MMQKTIYISLPVTNLAADDNKVRVKFNICFSTKAIVNFRINFTLSSIMYHE